MTSILVRSSENIVCFGGSNYYETPFTYDRIGFTGSEQFGDTSRAQLILNSSDCNEYKKKSADTSQTSTKRLSKLRH